MRLLDVCEFIVDCPHTTAKDEGKGYALIRTPNIGKGRLLLDGVHRVSQEVYESRISRATPQENDLILAREAPVGNVAKITNGQIVCLGQRTVLLRPNKDIVSPDFLTYYLLGPEQQHNLTSSSNGATVAHLNMDKIRNLSIDLPPRPVQDKIAGILSAYDEMIDTCKQQIALLEEAAKRLYREWFVDMRFPGHKTTPIGENGLPEGWSHSTLRDFLYIKSGKDHKVLQDGLIPVYGSGGIMRYGDKALYGKASILIPRKGSLNNILLVEGGFWTIDTMFYTEMKEEGTLYFTYQQIKDWDLYAQNIGAAVPSMNTTILYSRTMLRPSKKIIEQFNNLISPYYSRIFTLKHQLENLIEVKNLLLPRLISGQIEITA